MNNNRATVASHAVAFGSCTLKQFETGKHLNQIVGMLELGDVQPPLKDAIIGLRKNKTQGSRPTRRHAVKSRTGNNSRNCKNKRLIKTKKLDLPLVKERDRG